MSSIRIEPIEGGGAVVELPRMWPVRQAFRKAFRRARPGERVWTWRIPGKLAVRRAERFAAEIEAIAAREARRRAWEAEQAEWEAA